MLKRCPDDQEKLIHVVRSRLSISTSKLLLLGGQLTLINLVLTSIPTYQMLIFKLPRCIVKSIDYIRRGFLWREHNIDKPKYQLVNQKWNCKSLEQRDQRILNFLDFNNTLLGKRWQKILSNQAGVDLELISLTISNPTRLGTCINNNLLEDPF